MNFKFNKKSISNIVFILVIATLLYPPSKEWVLRQIAFSPSVNVESTNNIGDYNWELKGLNTKSLNLKDLENRVVFVNFWATWCPPCRAEMPMIQELYNDYKDKIDFIFVTNENLETVNKFFKKNNYNLPVFNSIGLPPSKLTETNSIPATYLIDKKGNIVINEVGSANWNSKKVRKIIDELLTE
ncbi:TlpA family protein disulfide reductase [Lutibacter citreus]|uniref:TlpA family protein disulfide reductase n=1 Tax=Lutibacter citreus TaxID=2138210 RepID=UPI000DBE5D8D|nr:TlpA disulfide reductase family protein [Lutibacter citreus]